MPTIGKWVRVTYTETADIFVRGAETTEAAVETIKGRSPSERLGPVKKPNWHYTPINHPVPPIPNESNS